ncbi:MAG: hypothetical protein ABSB87_11910 [Terriglobales bacterium]|jgi:hypothetical protein
MVNSDQVLREGLFGYLANRAVRLTWIPLSGQSRDQSRGSGQSLRVPVTFVLVLILVIFFFAIVFFFVLFVIWFLPKEGAGSYSLAGIGLALVPVELLLKAGLRIGSPPQGAHRDSKFPTAKCADSKRGSGTQPLRNPETAFDHGQLFLS